jgi:exopolyphosphatase/guanosine-5'-triphosphate,3'-diphosphate pyrophosphatase
MRMGVLDIGSNTGHLLVVDGYRGAPPIPAYSYAEPLRLAEHLDDSGAVTEAGISRLETFLVQAKSVAADKGCAMVLAFATSAVRDSPNSDSVLDRVQRTSGVDLQVLPGADEARLTFLAVRRWFGWSSGRLGVFDIGGGSLEIAAGPDEDPDIGHSLPLGAGKLTRDWLDEADRSPEQMVRLRRYVRTRIADDAGALLRPGMFDRAVATSKTFRSLARMCGAAASSEGRFVPREIKRVDLVALLERLCSMAPAEVLQLPGVSSRRAHQMLAGAVVADAVMDLFDFESLQICPWALREGVLLERLDQM